MRPCTACLEQGAQIDRAAGRRLLQGCQFVSTGGPALAGIAVTDLKGDRYRYTRLGLPAARLEPEVVCEGGSTERCDHYETGNMTHRQRPFLRSATRIAHAIAGVSLILLASPAYAHEGTGLPGGFIAGVLHPLTGPDHLLAMVSVGLWGHFLQRPLIYLLPMVFPIMMAVGAGLGMIGVALPPVELGIALSVVVLGALVFGAIRAEVWLACIVVGIFALFHGYAHGIELPSAADPIGYSLGFVFATGTLHVLGIAIGSLANLPRGETFLRALGGLVFLVGLYFLQAAWA